ncbi:hypothetical protein [Amycolatopsis japonica]|uniref:hypothetical protein n=1 Tax=Amycolatopsis japonica TaxID=208439 RepID=UPI0037FA68AA
MEDPVVNWATFIGPLGVAAFGVGGVIIGSFLTHIFTGRRDKRTHKRELYSKLVDKVYDLYPDYHRTLSRIVETVSGVEEVSGEKVVELRERAKAIEQEMQVFASRDVLDAFDIWQRVIVTMVGLSKVPDMKSAFSSFREEEPDLDVDLDLPGLIDSNISEAIERLLEVSSITSSLALAAVRVDLRIDAYKSWFALRKARRSIKKVMASRSSDAGKRTSAYPSGSS